MSPNLAKTAYARSMLLIKITVVSLVMLAVLLKVMVHPGLASELNSYVERETLVASAAVTEADANLGRAVAASGDTVAVGAPDADDSRGQVLVYVRPETGWAGVTATETATLTLPQSEAAPDDLFGSSVSISGDTIVVGAMGKNVGQGAAYVFVRPASGWSPTSTYVASLTLPSPVFFDSFGEAVYISGDTIVVGAPGLDKAYVFERPPSGWASTSTSVELSNSDIDEDFGASVATRADTIVVGAPRAEVNGQALQGAVYVFEKPLAGWAAVGSPTEVLTSAGDAGDNFGISVDIREDGRAIVVGADNALAANENATNGKGAAYVYMRPGETWASEAAFISDTLTAGAAAKTLDEYGNSVAISGDTIVVGAPGFRTAPDGAEPLMSGAAFVYIQPEVGPSVDPADAWVSTDTADEILYDVTGRGEPDEYGYSVTAFGGTVVVGVPGDDLPAADAATNQGSARVFENEACSAQSGAWDNASTWVGDVPTATSDVCISTNHIVTLAEALPLNDKNRTNADPVQIRRLLVNPGGELNLPAADIFVTEQVVNHGTLVQRKPYDTGVLWTEMLRIEQSLSGFTVFRGADISSTTDLGGMTLTLRSAVDWFSPTAFYNYCTTTGADSPPYAKRCFNIEPEVNSAADITLWARLDELDGIPEADLIVYRFAGGWQQLSPATLGTGFKGIGYINVSGHTAGFSDFLIGDVKTSPTAVDLVGFSAKEIGQNTAVLPVTLVLAALAGLSFLLLARRRRTKPGTERAPVS